MAHTKRKNRKKRPKPLVVPMHTRKFRGEGHTTPECRREIVAQHSAGKTYHAIARDLGVTHKTVAFWVGRYADGHGSRRAICPSGKSPPAKHLDRRQQLVHFMAWISADGKKSNLRFLPKGVTWTSKLVRQLCRGLCRPGIKVVMDGAKVHGALKAALVAAGAQVLPHPPYSPDLNPIENVWATLKEKASRKGPLPPGKLKEALEAAWKEIKPSDFKKYAASMQGRLVAVIERGGEHTKY